MKRFLAVCACLLALVLLYLFLADKTGLYIDWNPGRETTSFTRVEGKTILVDGEPFEIRGVDMGVGIPGHFATDYAIDRETYLRWFGQIQEMGANCIRVYTILQDDFYEAFYEYNKDREEPLYLLHGLWVNDYVMYSHRDAFDPEYLGALIEDGRTLIDILHGNKTFSLSEDLGSGAYTRDISPWVLGYILGVEWEDTTVAYTDHMQKEKNSYQGEYLFTSEDASPFEAMLAQMGDWLISYETRKYHAQRLVAFANWPTTDPFDWEEQVSAYFRKFAKVDVEHIRSTEKFLSGQFASYHIYPYFPDYLGFQDVLGQEVPQKYRFMENGVFNSYRAYLSMINDYHTMPVVVSEYGVPAARGRAQTDRNTGRSQGGMSEKEQAEAAVSCYEDIMKAGCAGSVLFTWQDEWFKRTWNTMAYSDLTKTPYWCDVQTNEQHFGILAFDPGKERCVSYVDGDMEEWENVPAVVEQDGLTVQALYDEAYLTLRIHKEGYRFGEETLYVPLDVTPRSGSKTAVEQDRKPAYERQGSESAAPEEGTIVPLTFERPADFLLVLDGRDNSRVLVQERYEALRAVYSHLVYAEDAYLNPPAVDATAFVPIRLMLQVPLNPGPELENFGYDIAETFDTGLLRYGNGNPSSPDYDSLADFCVNGDDIEIRLPWLLLNFSNPSEMMVHDDYYLHYGVEEMSIEGIYVGAASEKSVRKDVQMAYLPLKGWGSQPTFHERLREGYYALQRLWTEP